jgi:nitrogen fixation NifU-like protein
VAGAPHEPMLYQQLILEHYRRPANRGRLAAPTHHAAERNPLCGDEVSVECLVSDGRIADVAFDGHACSVSQASASMMTQAVRGHSSATVVALADAFAARLRGDRPRDAVSLGDLEGLLPVARFPARITCALLPWKALVGALERDAQ